MRGGFQHISRGMQKKSGETRIVSPPTQTRLYFQLRSETPPLIAFQAVCEYPSGGAFIKERYFRYKVSSALSSQIRRVESLLRGAYSVWLFPLIIYPHSKKRAKYRAAKCGQYKRRRRPRPNGTKESNSAKCGASECGAAGCKSPAKPTNGEKCGTPKNRRRASARRRSYLGSSVTLW